MKLTAPIFKLKHRAKIAARERQVTLSEMLDLVANEEGFQSWSALSSHMRQLPLSQKILTMLDQGDLLLLAGLRGEGKTVLGLQLLTEAARAGRRAAFFTLEYTSEQALVHLRALNKETLPIGAIDIYTSDDISADYIIENLCAAKPGTVAIIDYLQILDQQRVKPSLDQQISQLSKFAKETGTIIGFISQVDRRFDALGKSIPDLSDIRLPNLVDLRLFDKACFLHQGAAQLRNIA